MVYDPFSKELNINQGGVPNQSVVPVAPTPIPTPAPIDTRTFISSTTKPGYIKGYDTTQNFAPVFVPKNTYVKGISLTNKGITPANMAPVSGYTLPSGEPGTQTDADKAIALAKANTEAVAKAKEEELAKNPPLTEAQTKNQSILDEMVKLTGEGTSALTERATALQSPEIQALKTEQGITDQKLGEIVAESAALDASYQSANERAKQGVFDPRIIQGKQQQLYRQYTLAKNELATRANVLRATSLGLQGRISDAKQTIQDAFDSKVAIINSNITNWKAQADALAPTLNREETARLEEVKARKEKEREDAKNLSVAQTKAISDLYDAGVAVDSATALEINKAKTANDVQNILTKFAPQLAKAGQSEQKLRDARLANIYSQIAERNEQKQIVVDPLGKVVLKPEEALKINKELVNNDAYKAIRKGQDSLQYLLDFEKKFKSVGLETLPGKDKGELATKYQTSLLNLKEFFNLGVLNGPDLSVLEGIMPNPTKGVNWGPWGILPGSKKFAGVKSATTAGIETLKENISKTLDDRYQSLASQYGDYSSQSLNSLADLQRIYVQQKASLDPNLQKMIDENPNLQIQDVIQLITQP